jgi:hypothetical protein
MWFSPRQTIRRIVDAEVRPAIGMVIALAALHQAFHALPPDPADGTSYVALATMPVVVSILQLVYSVLVGPFLIAFVSGWLGGEADASDIRQAVAWSYVPSAVGALAWPPIFLLSGIPDAAPQTAAEWAALPFALAGLVTLLWTLVLEVITLAEVQRFSILRAIACLVILLLPALLFSLLT